MQSSLAKQDRLILWLAIIVAIMHGVIYTFLMPPWQHYDEPNHFEYVWMAANLNRSPAPTDYNPKLSRQVLKSMVAKGFFDHLGFTPVVGPPIEKIKIPGFPQLSEQPLYYWLASVPLRFIPTWGVNLQLYAARLVSLLFLVITVLAGWGIARELVQPRHPLRWMLPMTIAMTPAFVDLMTAVNNDVLAIAVASLFLWISVRMICKGFTWLDFTGLSVLAISTYFVKSTAMVVLVAYPMTLLFSLLRGRWRKTAWILWVLMLVAGIVAGLRWDDSFAWYRNTTQSAPTRQESDKAVAGSHAFVLDTGVQATKHGNPEVFQNLPSEVGQGLAGRWVTFGYWIWSDLSLQVGSPILRTRSKTVSEKITLASEPTFYAFQVLLPADTDRIWIYLYPEAPRPTSGRIYYDGLVLAEGRRPVNEIPQFDQANGSQGQWGGQPFQNILRNGSAELAGPRFSPWVDNLGSHLLPDRALPSLLLASLVDAQGSQDLYPTTAGHLFRTFWARFGWGHVPLNGKQSYPILFLVTMLSLGGALLGVFRAGKDTLWDVAVTMGSVVLLTLFMAVTRGGVYLVGPGYYFASARYIYPVIIPLLLLFTCSWIEIFHLNHIIWLRLVHLPPVSWKAGMPVQPELSLRWQYGLYLFCFLVLDILSLISVAQYYGKL